MPRNHAPPPPIECPVHKICARYSLRTERRLRTFVGSNCVELIGVIAPLAAAARALHMFRALGPCQSKPQGRRPVAKRIGAVWGANAEVQKGFEASTPAP